MLSLCDVLWKRHAIFCANKKHNEHVTCSCTGLDDFRFLRILDFQRVGFVYWMRAIGDQRLH